MVRALLIAWAAAIGYYALRVTVWAVPDSCPDTVWESTEDPRCDWNAADVTWMISLPVLALAEGSQAMTQAVDHGGRFEIALETTARRALALLIGSAVSRRSHKRDA